MIDDFQFSIDRTAMETPKRLDMHLRNFGTTRGVAPFFLAHRDLLNAPDIDCVSRQHGPIAAQARRFDDLSGLPASQAANLARRPRA